MPQNQADLIEELGIPEGYEDILDRQIAGSRIFTLRGALRGLMAAKCRKRP